MRMRCALATLVRKAPFFHYDDQLWPLIDNRHSLCSAMHDVADLKHRRSGAEWRLIAKKQHVGLRMLRQRPCIESLFGNERIHVFLLLFLWFVLRFLFAPL